MNQAMVKTLVRIVGNGGYRPESINAGNDPKRPETMRELIEKDWECADVPYRDTFRPNLQGLESHTSRLQTSVIPIDAAALADKRCRLPQRRNTVSAGVVGFQPLCRTFLNWLQKNTPQKLPNIDHPLDDEPDSWPLIVRFEDELRKRGPWGYEDLFTIDMEEPQTTCAWVGLYDICDDDSDRVPLLIYLEKVKDIISGQRKVYDAIFPETVIEFASGEFDVERMDFCERVFVGILKWQHWRLLPKLWAKAFKALAAYPYGYIAFYDPDQSRYETGFEDGDPKAMDTFFTLLKTINAVMEGTWELVKECEQNAQPFWLSFLSHLQKIGKRHPEIAVAAPQKNQLLIKVLA